MAQEPQGCSQLPPQTPYPYLALIHGKALEDQRFYDVISEQPKNRSFATSIPEFRNKPVVISSHGWLIVYQHPSSSSSSSKVELQLLNPVTLESIQFPPFSLGRMQTMLADIILTKPPTDPDSVILVFAVGDPHSIIFCHVGEDQKAWTYRICNEELMRLIILDDHDEDEFDYFVTLVFCNDRIYVSTTSRGRMAEIEIVKPRRLVIRPFKCGTPSGYSPGPGWRLRRWWTECCGDLFVIALGMGGIRNCAELVRVVVFKLDFSKLVWNVVESCPNLAFYLSFTRLQGQAMACPIPFPDSDKAGNRVYFTSDGETVFTYHIQHKTISASFLNIDLTSPCESPPTWILIPDAQALAKAAQDYRDTLSNNETGGTEQETRLPFIKERRNFLLNIKADEGQVTVPSSRLDGLPVDILQKIIYSHLINPLDLLSFRAVNRLCRSLITINKWKRTALVSDQEHFKCSTTLYPPLLMVPSMVNGVSYMMDANIHNKYYFRMPFGEGFKIAYSANGWLLMTKLVYSEERRHNVLHSKLYNPLTKSTISLPDSPIFQHFFFSSSPASSDCIVYGILFCSVVYCVEPGKSNWVVRDVMLENDDEGLKIAEQSNIYPICVDGCFYLQDKNGSLGVFSWEEHGHYTMTRYDPEIPIESSSLEQKFLVECGGGVLSVNVGKGWKWLRVFKLNRSSLVWRWEEVKDLENKNLYLSAASHVTRDAEKPGTGNKIYFPRFYSDSVIYFSMNTGKFHYSNSKGSAEDENGDEDSLMSYNGSKEQLYCCWFELRPSIKKSENC